MHIEKYWKMVTCGLEFKIYVEKDTYFPVRWEQISQGCDALKYAAAEYLLFHFLWMWGEK